ncbi:glucocorticoid modulatory element-binding protein 1 isoform X2 [Clupea harengus]|uniref:Glucocorticoid modulatory element-binding protein 1 isoform X2 n=1 Tax=Clupea harengus TaxID=7950 RepID=A0A8M1KIQ1_CLUHA|nr:glucocorticoid modulatory element-binding protein 1 isoform X2 [Clupea harengus]
MSLTRKCIESRLRMFASISECKDVFDVVVKAQWTEEKAMANTEITVSMGDMVVVKTTEEDDEEPDNGSKTQVILQLQPITHGLEEDAGEEETAMVAVEAQEATIDGEEVELGYPITCGESKAVLLFKKFVCPGINVKCVKYDDQLISPKQFVHMSGKATLKDWKRAIRMGGVMLRKMMDSGQLDFYQHSTLCTNTCRSTKFDLLISNTRFPPDSTLLSTPTSASVPMGNGEQGGGMTEEATAAAAVEWSTTSMEVIEKKEGQEISEDTLNFWKGIADVGLMGEVVTNIRTELLEMLKGVQLRSDQTSLQDSEVAVLSNLVQVFGLLDSIKKILNEKRQQTDPSQEQDLHTLTSLEQQLEEQKKQQAQSWLALNSMVAPPPPPPTKRAPKRPRLQRPASTTTLLGSSTTATSQAMTLQPQQFTVLSPITLTSMGQPFTLGNLPIATLAQPTNTVTLHTLPGGSQIFTRYTTAGAGGMSVVSADGKGDTYTLHPSSGLTLVGTATMQDPSQLGAMMSPVELVQLTQGAIGAEGMMVSASGAEVMEGTMLVQQELGRVVEEENQHTTVIEIDPAPGQQHTVGVMELQLAGASAEAVDEDEVTTVVVQGSMMTTADGGEEEEAEEGTPMEEQAGEEMQRGQGEAQEEEETEQGEGEEVTAGDLQLEAHGQLETLQIMVVEDGTPAANTEDK